MKEQLRIERFLKFVADNPGCSELQVAKHLYGPNATQQRVNPLSRALSQQGRVLRRKDGNTAFRLYVGEQRIVTKQVPSKQPVKSKVETALGHREALKTLCDLGFEHSARWKLESGKAKVTHLRHTAIFNVLYAFVVDHDVYYIGKTTQSVKGRMSTYMTPGPKQSTNIKCHKLILNLLESGKAVDVFVLVDNANLTYKGFTVSLAEGLESTLIAHFEPPWNTRIGKRAVPSPLGEG